MKIGILTHPQRTNYGGLLQCYALCSYLRKIGHEPIVIQRVADRSFFLWVWMRAILKAIHFPRYYTPNVVDRMVNIRPFIQKYLVRTEPIDSEMKMKKVCQKHGLKAVIVGSDQVWRHDYAMKFGYNYFLDFATDNTIKVSYAASFGLSEWYYTPEQTRRVKQLLSRFRGISVREKEAVELVKNNTEHDALQLIDPTLLLTQDDYNTIISPRLVDEKYVFVYWLGDKSGVQENIQHYRSSGYKVVDLNLRDKQELISVEDWLSYIKYADHVVTDSFHGCVFSILFQRQFTIHSNTSGGNGRLSSLFSMLDITQNGRAIDYIAIFDSLNKHRNHSYDFLNKVLL